MLLVFGVLKKDHLIEVCVWYEVDMHALHQLGRANQTPELGFDWEFSVPAVYKCDTSNDIWLACLHHVCDGLLHRSSAEDDIVDENDGLVVETDIGIVDQGCSFVEHYSGNFATVRQDGCEHVVHSGRYRKPPVVDAQQHDLVLMKLLGEVERHAADAALYAVGIHKENMTSLLEGAHALLEHGLDASPGSADRGRSVREFGLIVHGLDDLPATLHFDLDEIGDLLPIFTARFV